MTTTLTASDEKRKRRVKPENFCRAQAMPVVHASSRSKNHLTRMGMQVCECTEAKGHAGDHHCRYCGFSWRAKLPDAHLKSVQMELLG